MNCNITPSANDTNVIYYVSGYIARSIIRVTKCDECTEVLRESNVEPLIFDESMDYQSSEFFDAVNRGGLSRPTELTFLLVIHCWQVYEEIKLSKDLRSRLLTADSQRQLFCKVIERTTYSEQSALPLDHATVCSKGHNLKMLIASRFFNCAAKNLVKDLTNKAENDIRQSSKKRKIAKLTSSKKHL